MGGGEERESKEIKMEIKAKMGKKAGIDKVTAGAVLRNSTNSRARNIILLILLIEQFVFTVALHRRKRGRV